MTISIWRYSHLTLAVSSFVFILLASVTGLILAIEPIYNKTQSPQSFNLEKISLAYTLEKVNANYEDIFSLEINNNNVVISGIDKEGNSINGYINPLTAQYLSKTKNQNEFFSFITNLHRSLFLKSTGRFLVGFSSLLLLLIAISGIILIIKRQLGIKNFFGKIHKENFAQYYHVLFSRFFLIPIVIISLSGVYLSLLRFDFITEDQLSHQIDFENLKDTPVLKISEFEGIKDIPLSEVKMIEFPFSDFIEDYYVIKLQKKEMVINQFNGEVISNSIYSNTNYWNNLSIDLHTGRGNISWSIVLLCSCISILFFIYSGFTITLKRRANLIKNKYKKDDCKYIILVGSETGNTYRYASLMYKSLLKNKEKVFITELNKFSSYKSAEQLIIFTSTYGDGESPTNGNKFKTLLNNNIHPIKYNVIGFGSLAYPNFCQFAIEVDTLLKSKKYQENIPLFKINDQSFESFNDWFHLWKRKEKNEIKLVYNPKDFKPKNTKNFKVLEKTSINSDNTFCLTLKSKQKFKSGDLLAIYPNNNHIERLYSIGKIDKKIQLSIKLHDNGIGSNFLNKLTINQKFKAKVISNKKFHLPKHNSIILISNGTGIAPFLGMINENKSKRNITLYAGFRTKQSINLYKEVIDKQIMSHQLSEIHFAFSQENKKQHVTHLLKQDKNKIAASLKNGTTIMICGSLKMYRDVLAILSQICTESNLNSIDYYISNNQVLSDCY